MLGRVENTVGKGENASYQHFLFYPQSFQKLSFQEVLIVGIGIVSKSVKVRYINGPSDKGQTNGYHTSRWAII